MEKAAIVENGFDFDGTPIVRVTIDLTNPNFEDELNKALNWIDALEDEED